MQTTTFEDLVDGARDLITVKRVYGDPYEQDGMTVIPAASVRGGGGGGAGRRGDDDSGSGAGFGMMARPSGAWIIKDGRVTWKPAVDANRIALGGQIVGLVSVLVAGWLLNARLARGRSRRLKVPEAPRRLAGSFARPRWSARPRSCARQRRPVAASRPGSR